MRHLFTSMAVELVTSLTALPRLAGCVRPALRFEGYGRLAFRSGNEYRVALHMRILLS